MKLKGHPSIAAAWRGYQELVMHPQAPQLQRDECRLAFWAGAATLFYAIMQGLDEGTEPTDADMARMDAIHSEIDRFTRGFDDEVLKRHQGRQ